MFSRSDRRFISCCCCVGAGSGAVCMVRRSSRVHTVLRLGPCRMGLRRDIIPSSCVIKITARTRCENEKCVEGLLVRTLRSRCSRGVPFAFLVPTTRTVCRPCSFQFICRRGRVRLSRTFFSTEGRCGGSGCEGVSRRQVMSHSTEFVSTKGVTMFIRRGFSSY